MFAFFDNKRFEFMRHDVTVPLYVEVAYFDNVLRTTA